MYTQKIERGKISQTAGFFMIIGIVAAIYIIAIVVELFSRMVGFTFGWVVTWLAVGAVAVFIMTRFIRAYRYSLVDGMFVIERMYGRRAKAVVKVPLSDIRDVGDPERLSSKYKEAKARKFVVKGYAKPLNMLAYQKDGAISLAIFQPDERLLAMINERKGMKTV